MNFDLVYAVILLTSFASTPILGLVLFVLWKKRGQDPKGKATIIPQYGPYQEIPPAVMALVLYERIRIQDILATVIQLAQRGYLQVEYQRAAPGQVFKEKNVTTNFIYILHQIKKPDAQLKPFELLLLKSIFNSGPTRIILDFLENELLKFKPQLDQEIYKEAIHLGFILESPEEIRKKYSLYSKLFKRIGWVLFITGVGVPLVMNGYILNWFGKTMPVRTKKGVEALRWSQGVAMYIQFAERYRLNRPAGELQQLLPEAIVLGVVDQWSQHVKTETAQIPPWYQAPVSSQDAFVRFVDFLSRDQ